ncbi:MAG: hypothetical protein D6678_07110 [Zetaproteobacteria bacterium]|nr:MAG: hypothetical protein D6678_07110 [Zetaproteobacteria bacterium]
MHDPTAINRYRFAEARAPALADRAGELQPEHLLNWCRLRMDHPGITLIEGVGGLMVPLTRDFLVADWIRALAPNEVWLVVRARLGAINHMLLSIAQLAQMQMPPRHIILNAPDDEGRGYLADLHRALKMVACNAKVHTLLAGEMPVPQDFGLRVRGEND